jgi:hypothetical protein
MSARTRGSAAASSRRLRLLYFGAASFWGFAVGVGGLIAGLGIEDTAMRPGWTSLLALVPAAGAAIGGAGIIAGAYQEAKRRRR